MNQAIETLKNRLRISPKLVVSLTEILDFFYPATVLCIKSRK